MPQTARETEGVSDCAVRVIGAADDALVSADETCGVLFDMHFACTYSVCMSMLQIRNVPEDLHRELKSRAALAGMSVSEYLLLELRRSLDRPTRETLLRRLSKRAPVRVRPAPADAVRAERKRR
jgi:hypothetical protein